MTEDEKEALKNFIDSLYHVPLSQEINSWKERALKAEEHLLNIKNALALAKNVNFTFPYMYDTIAKLVFRWNESENLRNQLTEIDMLLCKVKNLMGPSTLEKLERLVFWHKNLEERNLNLNEQVTEMKKYLLKLSEDLHEKSL